MSLTSGFRFGSASGLVLFFRASILATLGALSLSCSLELTVLVQSVLG